MKNSTRSAELIVVAVFWALCFLPLAHPFTFLQAPQHGNGARTPVLSLSSNNNNNDEVKINEELLQNTKILILPGFGNDSNDYYLEQAPQGSLVRSLEKRGWKSMVPDKQQTGGEELVNEKIRVLPLTRLDWLQVFLKGATDIQFWRNDAAPTRPAFAWYLERVAAAVEEMTRDDNDDTKVVLICHSAGGWLARACLGFCGTNSSSSASNDTVETDEDEDNNEENPDSSQEASTSSSIPLDRILGVVTLGAPHLPPPLTSTVMDMTRGALRITHETFPGAYHKDDDDVFYITVAGNAVRGEKQERESPFEPTSVKGFAYNSYEAVLGDGTALGDGVVPVDAAHLEDAIQIDLDDIFHSINAPDQWYGSDAVIDSWHDTLLEEIKLARQRQRQVVREGNSRV